MTSLSEYPTPDLTGDSADPREALGRLFGFAGFRPGQEPVVRAVLAGEDLLAVMPTGAGKSLCYQLPAFLLPGCTVVISPLVALMKDQLDSLPPALRERAAVFNSTIEREDLEARTADLLAGRLKLVYVAPERLRQRPFVHALARAEISRFVVDEAHCISLWGHDFRPDYMFIPAVLEMLASPPVLLMTATATPELQGDLSARFDRPLQTVHTGVVRPNLFLEVAQLASKEEKYRRLIEICSEERGSGIVYVGSRDEAERLAMLLYRQGGIRARHYHAGMEREERSARQDDFMRNRVRVMVATIAFGMGVDKPDVRFIVHFNPSRSLEAYAQEAGRAGRDGEPARCVLFWTTSDKATLSRRANEDALSRELLNAVYRAVRNVARDGFVRWPIDGMVETVRDGGLDINETDIRVALGALEQVGVLRRYCDLPETAQLSLGGAGDEAAALTERLAIVPGSRVARGMFDVAEALECAPSEVEERLLGAQDLGLLTYHGTGRGLLLELLPHPPDLRERLNGLLDGYERAQRQRLDDMGTYATRRACRTAMIARHFGEAHAGRCGHCDVCLAAIEPRGGAGRGIAAPERVEVAGPERAPEDIIIECIAELPFQMGRTGVTKLLKGSVTSAVQANRSRHFGGLAALTINAIERELEALVEAGHLALQEAPHLSRDGRMAYLLAVTPSGFAKPAAPWPPLRPERPSARPAARRERTAAPQDAEAALLDEDALIEERFEQLREWRREQLGGAGLPAYTVLNDETLRLLAARRITSIEDITKVKGVGPAKLEKYGELLLEMLGE